MANTKLEEYIAEEIRKYQGVMVPVKAGFLERRLTKKAKCSQLHPNPSDEFCFPDIGPNNQIISKYVQMITRYKSLQPNGTEEPIIVEKVSPDGYMILNGHHRWAAAVKTGFDPVPISIVNLTQESDIQRMIRESGHDKRVTMDLEEVVFCKEGEPADKALSFPENKSIRLGIPALLHFLDQQGYDVWVYTASYYSQDDIEDAFKKYSVKVAGVITGAARKMKSSAEAQKKAQNLIYGHYHETLHLDRDMILRTWTGSKEFAEYPINAGTESWSGAVMNIVRTLK